MSGHWLRRAAEMEDLAEAPAASPSANPGPCRFIGACSADFLEEEVGCYEVDLVFSFCP